MEIDYQSTNYSQQPLIEVQEHSSPSIKKRTSTSQSRSKSGSAKQRKVRDNNNNKKRINSQSPSMSRSRSKSRGKKSRDMKKKGPSKSQSQEKKKKRYVNKPQYYLPALDGHLVSFRTYMEHQTDKMDTEKAEKLYKQYKREWEQKQDEIFYLEHKNEMWFQEKYDPFLNQKLIEDKKIESKYIAEAFCEDLRNGVFQQICLEITPEQLQFLKSNEQIQNDQDDTFYSSVHQEVFFKESIEISSSPFFGFDQNANTLFIKQIPKNISRQELNDTFTKFKGFLSFSLSEPIKALDFGRYGWIRFESDENLNKSQKISSQLVQKTPDSAIMMVKSQSYRKPIRIAPKINKIKTIEITKQLIEIMDSDKRILNNPLLKDLDELEEKRLDIQLLYLRKVHGYCYFCNLQYLDERMLATKCGLAHPRMKSEFDEDLNMDIPTWQKIAFDQAFALTQSIEVCTPVEALEKQKEKIHERILKKLEKKNSNNIWPCLYCEKKFKGSNFVLKHLETKHLNEYEIEFKKAREESWLENYQKDKYKITNYPSSVWQQNKKKQMVKKKANSKLGGKKYKDWDDPEVMETEMQATVKLTVINYHDI